MSIVLCPQCVAASLTSKCTAIPVMSRMNRSVYWDNDGTQKETANEVMYALFVCSRKHVWFDTKPTDL